MQVLIDTQIVYWFFYDDDRLPSLAMEIISDAEAVYVSPASLWEIALKVRIGKMKASPEELATNLEDGGFLELPIVSGTQCR